MRILILCDHYPLSPRVIKMRNSLMELYPNSIVRVFAWNRENNVVNEDYVETFNQSLGYGNKIKKALNLVRFIKQAGIYVKKFKPTYIHAIDVEMLLTSVLISNGQKIIYEVYDIKFFRNKILNEIREKTEFFALKKYVDSMILASPFFEIYYNDNKMQNIKKVTINNKPSKEVLLKKRSNYMAQYKGKIENKLVVGFIGTIRYKEILINLINASKELDNIVILLAGDGPYFEHIKTYINENGFKSKVIMTGRYSNYDLKDIYDACDYIWAAYPNKDLNVKYAISNKFFESIIFRKKVIVSESTMLGEYVYKSDNGLTVNPYSVDDIMLLLKSLKRYECKKANNSLKEGLYWEDEHHKLLNIYHDSKEEMLMVK